MAWNVVILGGGFGGRYAARKLERELPKHAAKVTVVADAGGRPPSRRFASEREASATRPR